MSMHDYSDTVGVTWRDKFPTRADLSKEAITQMINEGRHIMSSSLWGRYSHRGKHRTKNFFQRAYANLVMAWTPTFS